MAPFGVGRPEYAEILDAQARDGVAMGDEQFADRKAILQRASKAEQEAVAVAVWVAQLRRAAFPGSVTWSKAASRETLRLLTAASPNECRSTARNSPKGRRTLARSRDPGVAAAILLSQHRRLVPRRDADRGRRVPQR